ncbi:DUF3107 domain-containing protein [Pseudokineococcus marinus]|uniref:DUF3107 domain-containing protein n=1 Tax=Pseudokineococcus marinus TaxID=351215 RepID=A0A849BSG1_9ACTN|nr:DUF3107 domain-containing protein [Pseudokineococcus marinus]NNH24495.1 DUF3107 domain-containing protein [Pseudokineococcus marinus]
MEIRIGVQNVAREIVLESSQSADEVRSAVDAALSGSAVLDLVDERGRRVVVPSGVLGYVEIAAESPRRVGFGSS